MYRLHIDIETYSSNDLFAGGVYKYAEAPDFEILLLAFAWNDDPVEIISDEKDLRLLPFWLGRALIDPNVIKVAHNAQFERVCLSRITGTPLPIGQWECTMVKAATLGLPFSLDQVGKALKLDTKKDTAGKALIRYFSMPCKPTKTNGGRTRNLPRHDLERWEYFKSYCIQDVVQERKIDDALASYVTPETEKQLYVLDQQINDRGIGLDQDLIKNVLQIDGAYTEKLESEARKLSGLENPNSTSQLKVWLEDKTGHPVNSLTKGSVSEMLETATDPEVIRMLELRQKMAKTSIKKYVAMENCRCGDGRSHGLLQFYGANRTGRWAGRLVQIQNLPRIYMDDGEINTSRNAALAGDAELMRLLYDNVPDTLSQLVRTAFIPSPDHRLIVADFSAIEARVVAWLAGEKWRLEVFKTHGKIYESSAAAMFGVPVESIDHGSPLRQKGKVAELACGYGGGVGALKAMGALEMGLTEDELPGIISRWRRSSPAIVRLWSAMENAALAATETGQVAMVRKLVSFARRDNILFMELPSGRTLAYQNPMLKQNRFGSEGLTYTDLNQTTKKWERTETWGGKLVENAIQAIARDLLAEAMLRLDAAGYKIVGHVHDEVIIDAPEDFGSLEEVINIMTEIPAWAAGLPLAADGFESKYYKK